MKTLELKPCPFCGKEATCKETSHGHSGSGLFTARFFVGCEECKVGFSHESQFRLKGAEVEFINNGYEIAKSSSLKRKSQICVATSWIMCAMECRTLHHTALSQVTCALMGAAGAREGAFIAMALCRK